MGGILKGMGKEGREAVEKLTSSTDPIDTTSLIKMQVLALERDKSLRLSRLKTISKRIDHLERAYRVSEMPLLKEDYSVQQGRDRVEWEVRGKEMKEEERKIWEEEMATKARLARMRDDWEDRWVALFHSCGIQRPLLFLPSENPPSSNAKAKNLLSVGKKLSAKSNLKSPNVLPKYLNIKLKSELLLNVRPLVFLKLKPKKRLLGNAKSKLALRRSKRRGNRGRKKRKNKGRRRRERGSRGRKKRRRKKRGGKKGRKRDRRRWSRRDYKGRERKKQRRGGLREH
ncbi:hypothetical protein C8J55DRAFT_516915 [Lentinula edodes]|uniref:Uncharacterized protein n=1 Tax=Lentinula lateritia TaxID=40482 RepID=A0A9W9A8M4_9AGAR|nr:hypothetical protein C8J55DRAFT_516915 [Lentinula edodes]